MKVTDSDIDRLVGGEDYREQAIREALGGGVSTIQKIQLDHNEAADLLEIVGPTFQTVMDLTAMTERSAENIREHLDGIIRQEIEAHMKQTFQ